MTTVATTHLPRPDERALADVVIYDGHCSICTSQVERLARWDGRGRLAFMSLHEPEVYERYPDLSHDQLMDEMVVVDRHGGRHPGAAAFRYLSRVIPRLWPLAALMHIPGTMPLWRAGYRVIARWRYKFGRRDACAGGTCELHFGKKP